MYILMYIAYTYLLGMVYVIRLDGRDIGLGRGSSVICKPPPMKGMEHAYMYILLLVSAASLPSRTAGTIFRDIYMYPTTHFGPDCPCATRKRNRPCLFRSPSMRSIQLVYIHNTLVHVCQNMIWKI